MTFFSKISQLRAKSANVMINVVPPTVTMTAVASNEEQVIQSKFLPHNASALRNFVQHCLNEYSIENVICYAATLHFKTSPTEAKAMLIYNNFLTRSSPLEVNIKHNVLPMIKAQMKRPPIVNPQNVIIGRHRSSLNRAGLIEAFKLLEDNIMVNLLDSYARYELGSITEGNTWKFRASALINTINPEARQVIQNLHRNGITMPQTLLGL